MAAKSKKEVHPATIHRSIYATVALTVLLFLLGGLGVFVVYANNAVRFYQENIPFDIELADEANDAEVFRFQKELESSDYVKKGSVKYISKEEALQVLTRDGELTEEEILLGGENILPNFIKFNLKGSYMGQYKDIVSELERKDFVTTVTNIDMEEQSFQRFSSLGIIAGFLVIFFIFVAIVLIRNALKLSILAKKQLIKVLQLSGATNDYLIQPYLRKSVIAGFMSGLIAIIFLLMTILYVETQIEDLSIFGSWGSFVGIFIVLIGLGMLIYWLITQYYIRRYFKTSVDNWKRI